MPSEAFSRSKSIGCAILRLGRWFMVPWSVMLPVCCHPVAILLPFKCLTDNDVADVATFQTISTCKANIKALNINMVVRVFGGFLTISSWHPSNFSTVFPTYCANSSRRPVAPKRCAGSRFTSHLSRSPIRVHWRPFAVFPVLRRVEEWPALRSPAKEGSRGSHISRLRIRIR